MSPVVTCTETGGKEAVRRLNSLKGNLGNASTAIAKSMVMKVKRKALENLTAYPSNLLGTQLARFASAQPVKVEADGVSWGLPTGVTSQDNKGLTKPMSAIGLLHEKGGIIRPTGENKMLRIPLPPAMTAGGVDRYAGRDFHQRPPPEASGMRWFILNRGKNPIICMALSKAKMTVVTPMYALVYQSVIKPKWWLRRAYDAARAEFPAAAKDGMTILMRNTDGGGTE